MKFTTFSLAAVATCTLTAFASADVIMDHIGAMDGSDLAGSIGASQDFDAYGDYDVVAADVFTMDTAMNLSTASMVLGGWNGYGGLDGVTGFTVSIFSSLDQMGASIYGDVLAMSFDSADVNGDWTGANDLISFDLGGFELAAGSYYIGITANNAFADNGQTGAATSNIGNFAGAQGNPTGAFGFGPVAETGANYAYRLDGDAVPAPGAIALLGLAGLAGRRRRS
ncbi:MAG: hypothetical protein MK101_11870 [Phycisphaerales bacterium]|nr:hypothetical protein [Phycisphaerales bacterium]